MKQQFLVGKADTIRITIYSNNRPIIPTSANITIFNPSGSSLQAQTAATVNATTGEITYSLTSTHTATADLNYKVTWDYTVSGTVYYQNSLFDVVKNILAIPITDDDLYNELESLRKSNIQARGTADSAAAGTVIDAVRKEVDDYWKGGVIEILAGTGSGQIRDITGFTQSTGTFNITPNWDTNPDTTSTYRVVRSYSIKIAQSFEKIEEMFYSAGSRHELIIESSQIRIPLIYLTVHYICLDLMEEENDKWSRLATLYWDKFNSSFNGLKLEYDKDESGFIDGSEEEQSSPTEVRLFRC